MTVFFLDKEKPIPISGLQKYKDLLQNKTGKCNATAFNCIKRQLLQSAAIINHILLNDIDKICSTY